VLAVVGPDAADAVARLTDDGLAARALDGPTLATGDDALDDASAVVALGPDGLAAVADAAPGCPVLPVDADPGVPAVGSADLVDAARRLVGGDYAVRERTLLGVAAAGTTCRALLDVTLVTDEPAQISGYRVTATAGEREATLADLRADGLVVATPSGSAGYALDAGGPTLLPGTGALAVVPVAPFTVDRHRWVAPPPLSVTVTRDEGTVALRVDGRPRGTVPPGEAVAVTRAGTLALAAVPASRGDVAAMEKT